MTGFVDRLLGRVPLDGVLAIVAPVLAIVFAALVTSIVLIVTGNPPVDTLLLMVEYGVRPRTHRAHHQPGHAPSTCPRSRWRSGSG